MSLIRNRFLEYHKEDNGWKENFSWQEKFLNNSYGIRKYALYMWPII